MPLATSRVFSLPPQSPIVKYPPPPLLFPRPTPTITLLTPLAHVARVPHILPRQKKQTIITSSITDPRGVRRLIKSGVRSIREAHTSRVSESTCLPSAHISCSGTLTLSNTTTTAFPLYHCMFISKFCYTHVITHFVQTRFETVFSIKIRTILYFN